MKEYQVHVLIGVAVAVAVSLNGWAIFRGRIFRADLKIPGLALENGGLAFTPSLLGTFHLSPMLKNLTFQPRIFTQKLLLPDMADIIYTSARVKAWVDKPVYVPRCLRLATFSSNEQLLYLYGETLMYANGTGIDGTICQHEMEDPAAFARYDTWCGYPHLACMRDNYLLGCLLRDTLFQHHVENCGRLNSMQNGAHWSGMATGDLNWLKRDVDNFDNPGCA